MHNTALNDTGCLGFKVLFVPLDELVLDVVVRRLLFGWMSSAVRDRKELWIFASSGDGEDTTAIIEKMLE